jgi:2-oxo-4-hydroxy-4-carboxy-5-ureidoimidazoline decarboxylase
MSADTARKALRRLNDLPPERAEAVLLECCASARWATEVAAARPFPDAAALAATADRVYAGLVWSDVLEAVSAHPRIGDRSAPAGAARSRESGWSRAEQSGTATASAEVLEALRAANRAYEDRFGHVFLICASGLSAEQMLAALRDRLAGEPSGEAHIVRAELRKIVHLRLTKLLEPT